MKRAMAILALVSGAVCCGDGSLEPAALDAVHDACTSCRMVVSDRRLASQIVAPGDEPRFFDDLACLHEYLTAHPSVDAAVFVADHRTGEWARASVAVYSRLAQPSTPMASGLIAHADPASRDADESAARSQPVPRKDVLP